MSLRKERVREIVRGLERMYPRAKCSLDFDNAFELLVATILSAQSTDARVNQVTPSLFEKYPDARALAAADPFTLEREIHSTGFFRQKAKALLGVATALEEEYGGGVPSTMEELTRLPGVGRKTANVVLGNAFRKATGIVVDTHVKRVAGRLGLSGETDPEKIERDLMKLVPRKEWVAFGQRMILHGRAVCVARKPKCRQCLLNEICPSAIEPPE